MKFHARFSVRVLLILVTLFAIALGVWVKRVRDQQQVIDQVLALGGNVSFWHDRKNPKYYTAPAWLRRTMGDKWFVHVYSVDLQSLFHLTDEQVPDLSLLRDMERLNLDDTKICDATLEEVARLPNLRHLNLMQTRVSDEGLRSIGNMQSLAFLSLGGTDISEAGLEHLKRLQGLKSISVEDTNVDQLPEWLLKRSEVRVVQ